MAVESRPTGPAAAAASPPILNLLLSRCSIPVWFITSMITSVSFPPIRNPNLPPEILRDPGALQPTPLGFRHVKKPLPYCAPTMNPPAFEFGTTTTHDA